MLSPLLVREQCQLQIVHRAGGQRVGGGLHAVDVQLIIEYLDIEHRAEQGFITRGTPAVAHDLLGVVALVATHFFSWFARRCASSGRLSCG